VTSLPELPTRYVAAGLLITDERGWVLLVQPTYKPTWEIPGGLTELGETPPQTCRREVLEELGIDLPVGRLLVLEHQRREDMGDSTMHVYDGGAWDLSLTPVLPAEELSAWALVDPSDLSRLAPALAHRVREALRARAEGVVLELEHGTARGVR
jgi:8-oxo-dGTP diphosphatase